jgi:MSHA biogenesis protein MshQ
MCGSSSPVIPITDYRFDECSYTGLESDVFDATTNHPAQSFSNLNASDDAQIQRAANFSDAAHHIETSIPISGDFSVSTWFKKPTVSSGNRYLVLGAMANNGGDLLYLDSYDSYRWGVYDGNAPSNGAFQFGSLTSGWHHMVLVYGTNSTTLYIDGDNKGSVNRSPSGTIKYIGTSYDEVNTSSPQGFRTALDEFKVYDQALSVSAISTIYTHELASNNYDGTSRTAIHCPELIAKFSMDEAAWSGNAGEIIDETGNFTPIAINGAKTGYGTSALPGNPGTCGYGVFDGVDDYIQIEDDSKLDLQDELSISVWINPKVLPSSGLKTILSKDENYEFHLQPSGEIFWWWQTHSFATVGAGITAGNWFHIAITYTSGKQVIYVNGVEKGSQTFTGSLTLNNDPLHIGQDQGTTSRFFDGYIDEVQIFDGELSAAEINALFTTRQPCVEPVIDHYQIIHDGNGLTCEAEKVTIKACTNAFGASCTLSTDAVTLDLSVVGTSQSFTHSLSFIGSTEIDINYVYQEDISLAIANEIPTASNGYVCNNNAVGDCIIPFKDTGFAFSTVTNSNNIPNQIAGKPSNLGFSATTLRLRAVEKNTTTGSCQAVLAGDINIELAAECENPLACAGAQVNISGANILTVAQGDNALSGNLTSVSLNFGDTNQEYADFDLTYPDAGQLKLYAKYSLPEPDAANPVNKFMDGESNSFVVRPFGFHINIENEPNGLLDIDQDGAVFKKAGEEFTTRLTAVQWQASDDDGNPSGVANDGIPDNNDELIDNATTLNFGKENSPESVVISPGNYLPSEGELGELTNTTFTGFNSAFATQTEMTYSEVGIINFTANLLSGNYLSGGDNVTSHVPYVGRFIPAYFIQSIEALDEGAIVGIHNDTCPVKNWVYTGQLTPDDIGSINYEDVNAPVLTIKAYNEAGVLTKNYIGDFAKLMASDISFTTPTLSKNEYSTDAFLAMSGDVSQEGTLAPFSSGTSTYSLSDEHHFTYTRNNNAKVEPFDADFEIAINSIIDSDLVTIKPTVTLKEYFENPSFSSGVKVRFGRWFIENTSGSENSVLPQIMQAQYYNGSGFVTNTLDSCTVPTLLALDDKVTSGNIWSGGLADGQYRLRDPDLNDSLVAGNIDATVNGTFLDGAFNQAPNVFIFSAPQNGATGSLEFEYEVPSWMKYDWQNLGSHDDNPFGTLTFGVYRGNDRIISWREVGN